MLSVGIALLFTAVDHYVWFRYGWMTIYPLCWENYNFSVSARHVRGKLAPHLVDRFSYWLSRGRFGPVRRPDPYTIQLRPLYVVIDHSYLWNIWKKFDSGVSDYGAQRMGTERYGDRVRHRTMDRNMGRRVYACDVMAKATIARGESWEVHKGWGQFPYDLLMEEDDWLFNLTEFLTVRYEVCDLCVDPKKKPEWLKSVWQPLHGVGMPVLTR